MNIKRNIKKYNIMRIEKILNLIAAGIVLMGCSSDPELDVQKQETGEQPIAFFSYAQKATRGENSKTSQSQNLEAYHTTLAVYGYKYILGVEQDPVFDNVKLEYIDSLGTGDGAWEYSPMRYWDKTADGGYNFYAAAPYSVAEDAQYDWAWDAETKKFSLTDFSVTSNTIAPTSVINNGAVFDTDTDLMISTDIIGYNDFTANKVNLEFNHILTRINIGMKKDVAMSDDEVVLKEITICNTFCQGSYDESKDEGASLQAGSVARWNELGKLQTTGVGYNKTTTITTSYNYVYQALFIPQRVAYVPCQLNGQGLNQDSAPYLHVVYTINGETFSSYYNLADIFNGDSEDDFNFNEGWQNTLNININPSASRINFDATTYEWATNEQNVEI